MLTLLTFREAQRVPQVPYWTYPAMNETWENMLPIFPERNPGLHSTKPSAATNNPVENPTVMNPDPIVEK
jgi:hypothetical protein